MPFWTIFLRMKGCVYTFVYFTRETRIFIWFYFLDQICIFYFNFPSNCILSVRGAFPLTDSSLVFNGYYNYWYPCPIVLHSSQSVIKYIQVFVVYVMWSHCFVVSVLDTVSSFYNELWPGYVCAFIFEIWYPYFLLVTAGKDSSLMFYVHFITFSLLDLYLTGKNALLFVCNEKRLKKNLTLSKSIV